MRKALLIGALALTLTGCVDATPPVMPEPEPTATPLFASDEEALAAAEEAYGAYLAVSSRILAEGGVDPNRILPYISPALREETLGGYEKYANNGWHATGESTVDTVTLQQYSDNGEPPAQIVMYLCVDVTNVRTIDAAGVDITPADRRNRIPLEVSYSADSASEQVMILEGSDLWTGDDFCV